MSHIRNPFAHAFLLALLMLAACSLDAAGYSLSLYDGSATGYVTSTVPAGSNVSVKAVIPATAGFNGWQIHTGLELTPEQTAAPGMTFTMPDNDVTLAASFGTAVFLAAPSADDIPAYMTGTQSMVVAHTQAEGSFALASNTAWTAAVISVDGTSTSWLTLARNSGFGNATLQFETADYGAVSVSRTAGILLTPAATTVSPILVEVTQLPPDISPGFYFDTWNGNAFLNLFIQGEEPLAAITIPDTAPNGCLVTGIGSNAFARNTTLQTVTFQRGVTIISADAFRGCTALCIVDFPETLSDIRADAFADCTNLMAAELENSSVKAIGDRAFKNCTNLKTATLPTHLASLGKQAFYGCTRLQPGTLPRYLASIGQDAFTLTDTQAFEVNTYNSTYRTLDGVLFTRGDYVLVAYPAAAQATHYTVHSSTRAIGPGAFSNCSQLTSICMTDAENLTDIRQEAFQNATGLSHIQLPFLISAIGERAFAGCTNLQSVYASDTQPTIATDAFQDCTCLKRFYFYGGKPQFDKKQNLSPADGKTIYACKDAGWANGETFAGCTVNAAAASSLRAIVVNNGMPLAYAAPDWPVAAMAFPSGTMIFNQWTTVFGTSFTAEQQAANPVDFRMPKDSAVSLQASYVQPSFRLTLTHAKLSTGSTGGDIPANTPLRAIANMPSGASFCCWMSDQLALNEDVQTRQYLDFIMPFRDTELHAATSPSGIANAIGFNAPFISYGDSFWAKTTADAKSSPAAAAASGKQSYLATTVTGPAYFAFYAKINAPQGSRAELSCQLGSQSPSVILAAAGASQWTPCSIYIPAGTQTVKWLLDNPDGDATALLDSACVYPASQERYLKVVNTSGSGYYPPGSLVTVIADSIEGKGFVSWNAPTLDLTAEELQYPVLSFIMPNRDTQLTAVYEDPLLGIGPADTAVVATISAAITCTADTQTRQMVVYANAPWTASSDADWLSITPDATLMSAVAALDIRQNDGPARTGRITLQAENGECMELTVTQHGASDMGFLYDAWDGDATITLYLPDPALTQLNIPRTLDGFDVTSISPGALRLVKCVSAYTADETALAVSASNGILYSPDMTALIAYPPQAPQNQYTLPDTVQDIEDYAFANCSTLQTLTLSNLISPSVFTTDAFEDCTEAIIAFATHTDNARLVAVNGMLFSPHLDTLIAYPPGNTAPSCTLPTHTQTIAPRAFNNARHLNMIVFPPAVRALGEQPFRHLEDCIRFLVFQGNIPFFADNCPLPTNATIYIHENTIPTNAWETYIAQQGNDLAYFQDDASLTVISSPTFISYDGQYSITVEVSCSTGTWRIFRASMGENDIVWMPCDVLRDAAWVSLDWYLNPYPVNATTQNRSQTLWLTADNCAPAVIAVTQLCRNETITQNFSNLPLGWNAISILCNPFTDSVQYLVSQNAFVFEKRRLALRRASAADIVGGAQIWLYITKQLQQTLPYFPITGQMLHSQQLPATYGWHAIGIAVSDGIPSDRWNALYRGAWQWDGERFNAVSTSEPLIYGHSYWVHKP